MPDIFEADDLKQPSAEPASEESSDNETSIEAKPQQEKVLDEQETHTPSTPTVLPSQPISTNSHENHIHVLSSFCQNPVGIKFSTQHPGEEILLFLRAAFVTNIPWIVITILLALLPPFVGIFFPQFTPSTLLTLIPSSYMLVLLSLYYLALFAYAFVNFITWLYNIFFVTSERIIDVDFSNIVYHQVAATKIDLVEDVHYDQVGFLPSLFNFGTVFLATASESEIFEATNVPQPGKATSIIENIIGKGEAE